MAAEAETPAVPDLQLLLREGTVTRLVPGPRDKTEVAPRSDADIAILGERCEAAQYSPDGRLLAVVRAECVELIDTTTKEVVRRIPQRRVFAIHFSPLGTFLVTWHRRVADERQLSVWSVATAELVVAHMQRVFDEKEWPSIKFSSDEKLACRASNNVIHVFSGENLAGGAVSSARVPNLALVSVAPGPPPYRIAAFIGEAKGRPASLAMYNYPDMTAPVSSKSFFGAEHAAFHWAPNGSALVFHVQTGSSADNYYGDSHVYFMTSDGRIATGLSPTKKGPVFDIAWAPNSSTFVLIAGKSPPCSVLYNNSAEPVFEFGIAHWSTAKWSPHGRFLCLAGFGGMAGGMTFWDMNKKKKIGTTESDCTVTSEWSPDGRWFMTATTRPRLQTDNGIRFFTYNGTGPVHTEKFDSLYEAKWRPAAPGVYPDRPQSPGARGPDGPSSTSSAGAGAGGGGGVKSVGVYRPRHSTGLVSAMMSADRVTSGPRKLVGKGAAASAIRPAAGLPVGAAPPSTSKSANQRRREKKKQKAEEAAKAAEALEALSKAGGGGSAAAAAAAAPASSAGDGPSASSSTIAGVDLDALTKEDVPRKIKASQKKLKQIAGLKSKRDAGEALDEAQSLKIEGEAELLRLIEALEALQ